MKRFSICALVAPMLLTLVSPASAADPADATLAVPPAAYRSVFERNNSDSEPPAPDQLWRNANEAVHHAATMESSAMPMPPSGMHAHEEARDAHHHHHGE